MLTIFYLTFPWCCRPPCSRSQTFPFLLSVRQSSLCRSPPSPSQPYFHPLSCTSLELVSRARVEPEHQSKTQQCQDKHHPPWIMFEINALTHVKCVLIFDERSA